jgi:hypothetical protein
MITITVGTNSWVTLTEANDYLESQFGNNWDSITSDDDKKKCLITAFWLIYTWPDYSIPKTSTEENVKYAQIKLADWIYSNYSDWKEHGAMIAAGIKSFALPKWRETLIDQGLPFEVQSLLNDSLINSGGYFATFERELEN